MVSVSASVNLPLHHEVQRFSSGTGSPEWSRRKGRKTVSGGDGVALGKVSALNKISLEVYQDAKVD